MAFPTCSIDRARPGRPIPRRRRAFSVAEALSASVILAVAVVGIAGPLGAASNQSQQVRENGIALTLARQLIEEMSSKPLNDAGGVCHLGPEVGAGETSRSRFDSIDDYHDYSDRTDSLGTLAGQAAIIRGDGSGGVYQRQVRVEYRTTASGQAASSGPFALATVTVTTPNKQVVKVYKLFTRHGLTF